MHSFLNVINVMIMQLSMLNEVFEEKLPFSELIEEAHRLTQLIRDKAEFRMINQQAISFEEGLWNTTSMLRSGAMVEPEREAIHQAEEIFRDIFDVLRRRLSELKIHYEHPGKWVELDLNEFKEDFFRFFRAMQKNSRGRFNIVHNVAEKGDQDYLIHFEVDSDLGNRILMPLLFKDVIRDLVANARKYTEPGGRIDVGISLKNHRLIFRVEDSGMGIPEDELSRVFHYGYRATNARHMRTMGGGFGLTKALLITEKLNGELTIQSAPEEGTTVCIDLPVASVTETVGRKELLDFGFRKTAGSEQTTAMEYAVASSCV